MMVRTKARDYVFPAMAQVVRTDQLLVVRAYQKLYAWPLNSVMLYHNGTDKVAVTSLVAVKADDLDAKAARENSRDPSLCADCTLVLTRPAKPVLPDRWAAITESWQVPFKEQHAESSARHAMFVNYGSRSCDFGWTCYYGDYAGYYWYSNDGGGGGGYGDTSNPPSPPNIPPCTSPNTNKMAGTSYKQINGSTPGIFNDPPPGSNGQEAYGYIYTDGSGNYGYDSATYVNLTGTEASIPSANYYPGWSPVGFYHTHPHKSGTDPTQTDINTGLHFSPQDTNFAANNPTLTMYVAVLDSISTEDAGNPQVRWYSYNASTKTETLQGTVGSGGC